MSFAGSRLGACFFCLITCAAAAEPTLTVVAGGRTAIYTASGLLTMPGVVSVTIAADFAYKRSMTFQAIAVSQLLAGTAHDDTVRITANDGFRTMLPAAPLLAGDTAGAYLAIERPDAPWPALKPGEAATAGPFYLVWTHAERVAPSREQWPYRVVKIETVTTPAKRFPMTAPAASVPPNHPIRVGFAAFQKHCASCHTMNGGGESTIGPDLNIPYNPTEYLRPEALRRVIRDPQALHRWSEAKMPAFDRNTLPDRELAELIAYLRHMADHKISPPPR